MVDREEIHEERTEVTETVVEDDESDDDGEEDE